MSDSFFDRERAAIAALTDAVKARAAAEGELTTAFQAATDKAERDVARARKANGVARGKELGEIDAEHAEAASAVARRFAAERYTAERDHHENKSQLAERFTVAEQKAQTEYQDRLWSIDSVLEGREKRAKEQLEALQRKVVAGGGRVVELWEVAEPLLARCGVTRAAVEHTGVPPHPGDDDPITRVQRTLDSAEATIVGMEKFFLPRLAKPMGLLPCLLVAAAVGAVSFALVDAAVAAGITVGVGLILGIGLWVLLRTLARRQTLRAGKSLGTQLAAATQACQMLGEFAENEYRQERVRIATKHARKRQKTDEYYTPLLAAQKVHYEGERKRVEADHTAFLEANVTGREAAASAEEEAYHVKRAEAEGKFEIELREAEAAYAQKMTAATANRDAAWERMAADWRAATATAAETFGFLRGEGDRLFPGWDELSRDDQPLSTTVPPGVRFGSAAVDPASIPDGVPADDRLAPPAELSGPLPAFLPFPDNCAVVLKARDDGRAAAVSALQAMMLRFLTGLPPGKVRFTIIDPVGLGENFASFMHLADHDEKLVTGQIWTEPLQIEKRLTDLTDHTASVIQKYLRNQYKSIEEYNRAAGEVAEPYRVLVIANFPTNFTPEAAKRLVSIVNSGPSCGVCTLVGVDARATMPRDFALADLEAPSFVLNWRDGRFTPKDATLAQFPLTIDTPPEPADVAKIVQRVGKASRDSVRVEVPFEYIAPKPADVWHGSAAKGFDVPVGRAGATRMQSFALGRGTAQHALVAGKTGSGKSTLLHALITNLALTYSPEEAELYLIDFKEGVEFQWYATYQLPHARVVAIQSEREFGLSVLQRLDGILKERGERFRDTGVNDLAAYRAAHPEEKTPRILLVVDEFQQLFVEDDKLAQEAALLLDRLVRQGRAFGMHVLLGSQTLGGSYSLPRSTIDQMAVRVALQCSDADAQLILSKDNNAARLLSRPGEAIYNDQNGLVEGNDPFQVVWLSEEKREQILSELHDRAGDAYPPPLVFAGNTVADLTTNRLLPRFLESPAAVKAPAAWLGDPVAIKDPTAAVFRPVGSSNLLLIGQNEEAARGLFAASLLGLAAQLGVAENATPFTILDGTPDDIDEADYLRKLAGSLPHPHRVPSRADTPAALAELAAEIDRRQKGESADRTPLFLFIFGIHRFRELRKADDDFGFGRRGGDREPSPSERLLTILRDGPPVGVHTLVWCDSLTNLNRAFDRPGLREFGMRVLFQMSPTDSSSLMDSPAASKLGRNRALFLHEDSDRPEKFRPYGMPDAEWVTRVCGQLRHRVGLKEPAVTG